MIADPPPSPLLGMSIITDSYLVFCFVETFSVNFQYNHIVFFSFCLAISTQQTLLSRQDAAAGRLLPGPPRHLRGPRLPHQEQSLPGAHRTPGHLHNAPQMPCSR